MSAEFDYDTAPERYRLGMGTARQHSPASLYQRVATMLVETAVTTVLDVGCAEGVLRTALPSSGPCLVGLNASLTLLRAHPPPAGRAHAQRLPFRDGVFDAVTALNVLYHLDTPLSAVREARRVLRRHGVLIAATIARSDSPELGAYWKRAPTSFDAEDAGQLIGEVFDAVTVHTWDAPLITLPSPAAIRDYLLGRQAPWKPPTPPRANSLSRSQSPSAACSSSPPTLNSPFRRANPYRHSRRSATRYEKREIGECRKGGSVMVTGEGGLSGTLRR